MSSTSHTSVHPRGDAEARVQEYEPGVFLGSVRVGSGLTIQSTNPDHLDQLATELRAASFAMRERAYSAGQVAA